MKKRYLLIVCVLAAGGWFFARQGFSQAVSAKTVEKAAANLSGNFLAIPELVLVKAGTFEMGDTAFANALPVREVTLTDDFSIGKFEVTNQQYADMLNYAFVRGYLDKDALSEKAKKREARGVSKSPQKYQDVFDEHSQITFSNGVFKPFPGKEQTPVVEVTWYGAAFYCNMLSESEGLAPLYNPDDWSCQVYGKAGYRLPTEAEWEYAATYDDARAYPWGNGVSDDTYANIKHNVKNPVDVDTTPVGAFSPKGDSKLGICDLAGNVAEWCNDWYNDFYTGEGKITDPVGPQQSLYYYMPVFKDFLSARVIRGGSFLLDPAYRLGMGKPFIMDCVVHPEVYNNRFRSFDYLSRQVEGFRVVKTVVTGKTKPAFSGPQK